jgi:hypothetical protein
MDDTKSFSLRVMAAAAEDDADPLESALTVVCVGKDDRPTLAIITTGVIDADYYRSSRRARIRARVDQGEPNSAIWLVTDDFHTAFPYEGPLKNPKNVAGGATLLIEVPMHRRGREVLRFPIAGMESELAWLAPRCTAK